MTAKISGLRTTEASHLFAGAALAAFLLLCLTLLTAPASARDGFSATQSSSPFGALSAGQDDFLPVDQAYQLDFLFTDSSASALFQIAPEYYLYRDKLALYLVEGETKTALPLNLVKGEVIWDDYFEKETEVYRWQLEVPVDLATEGKSRIQVRYQGCADAGLCYPPQVRDFELDPATKTAAPVDSNPAAGATGTPAPSSVASVPSPGNPAGGLLLAMALAFGGGVLLNLMPCVFPVLSIKALAITHAGDRQHLHGWAYTAGVVGTFVLIAAAMLALRTAGEAVGWGFQLQSPVVVAVLVYLFFAMGLSLSGVTEFGGRLMGLGAHSTQNSGLGGSFSTGALATVVASPCTAPMMGSALGFAVTQPAPVALAVFAALGAGMAAPFLLLTYVPALARRLPRPGPWMETLKQLLAFPMYLTAVWLLWVLGRQTGSDGVALVLAGAVAIAFALWLWPGATASGGKRKWMRNAFAVAAVAGAAWVIPNLESAGSPVTQAGKSGYWQPYSPEALASARDEGRPVLINMTAAWCITCLANEKVVLSSDAITAAVGDLGITALKGDWTNQDPQITELLARYGRSSVPLYLLFPAGGGEPQILPQILTRDSLLIAMRSAAGQEAIVDSATDIP
ncbi:protein-disulfide reductase DsbD family protein [Microbulbifer hydrolyticus]|uniref:Cytochrome C biogenesis protein n=1 Tax=Microbulbifer hydrolyticus TaxID=48074 RepID=A0A6P1TGC7_9GAMM|nr:protein-disulfide reductase DsbD [Microbulbifer hydrolyticus]MBB5212950.1 thiol:disulfide interchange protein DsbD [Microbulbifer hydrolyticus]QHQ40319.1 cytochrome C biogenesis protein [Microbulbifer hydrolyticus]